MHFAVGMCGGAALALAPCLIFRRGWRFIPVGMTLGGLWALVPDMPRLWREDFPSLPFASSWAMSAESKLITPRAGRLRPLAASRDARDTLGPPSFDDARLDLAAGESKQVTIRVE